MSTKTCDLRDGQQMDDKVMANKDVNNRSPALPLYVEEFATDCGDKYMDLRQKIPLITVLSTIETSNAMNSTELRLRRWFKCTKFDDKCFATRNTCQQFLSHLSDKHNNQKLFCLYCSPIAGTDTDKQLYIHEDLVSHICSEHSYRKYQCNLCLYRSISVDHILIHQQSVHSRNFEHTVNRQLADEGDDPTHNAVKQTAVKICKILECTQLAREPMPDPSHYYQNHRFKRINGELMASQCLYCSYVDTNNEELYAHTVAAHPDYPILIYTGINARNSVNGEKEDNESNVVIDLKKTPKKRSFDESFSDADVTTNGVVDTYEFDIWTESEDEDMLLTSDDLSSDVDLLESSEPAVKRLRTDTDSSVSSDGTQKSGAERLLSLNQTPYYLAACLSAVLAVYFSVVVLSGH